jgi:hypothetical protein
MGSRVPGRGLPPIPEDLHVRILVQVINAVKMSIAERQDWL